MGPFTPDAYRITLEPDLTRFAFSGRVTIAGRMASASDEVILNAVDIVVRSCGLRRGEGLVPCRVVETPERQELSVRLPSPMEGPLELTIEYDGRLNDRMAGFYRSGYLQGSDQRFIAVTQFEENDARRAFPCQDHPSRKAVFDIEMLVDENLSAVSNMPVELEQPAGSGRKLVRFASTPRMSTYLLFFGAGDFESATSLEDRRVGALSVPGRIRQAAYGLSAGAAALSVCERLFATPYPLPKLDLIAVPDFAFGAMENWGAITFRENLLLHTPGITSRAEEQRICEVIAHEIAHQWFGDLVTPADWKYLWLNESFATLFGYRVVDEIHPDWRVREQFTAGSTEGALSRDGMLDTPAIEIAGDAPVVINASNAPVLYNKGAAVLRQIEDYLGEEGFRLGLTRYLRDHACGTASSSDFWAALEAGSGRPVTAMMESWIAQPGHPILTAERRGAALVLRQRRFTLLPADARQLWIVPVRVLLLDADGGERVVETVLDGETLSLPLDGQPFAYKLNAGQGGFYRVRYSQPEDLRRLEQMVAGGRLSAADRWGLQNDLFALARSGEIDIDAYLDHLGVYGNESDLLPAASIAGHLMHAWLVLGRVRGDRVAAAGRELLDRILQHIGVEPRAAEPVPTSLLRARILLPAAVFGVGAARDLGARCLEDLQRPGAVHPDIRQAAMQIGAWTCGRTALEGLTRTCRESQSEQERMNALHALGWLSSRELLGEALDFAFAEVPSRNTYIPIAAAAGNPLSFEWMWDWWQTHLPQLERLHRMHQERVIAAIVPFAGPGRAPEVAGRLRDYTRQRTDLAEAATLALELLQINGRMRARGDRGAA